MIKRCKVYTEKDLQVFTGSLGSGKSYLKTVFLLKQLNYLLLSYCKDLRKYKSIDDRLYLYYRIKTISDYLWSYYSDLSEKK